MPKTKPVSAIALLMEDHARVNLKALGANLMGRKIRLARP